jgi:diguanylate cyclase (GGDEF)-like protein
MIESLGNNIYFLSKKEVGSLPCNAYLIVDGEQGILIEPGNLLDYNSIQNDILEIINPAKIKHIIITHPDPDLTSSLPLFERDYGPFTIITEWRTKEILKYYGLKSDYYLIKENNNTFMLSQNRKLYFIPAPFLHFAGSFAIYDSQSKFLFTSDMFSGYSIDRNLYADESYFESMAMYHENYMPSSEFIRSFIKKIKNLDIEMILPQHGSIINKPYVEKCMDYLYEMDFYNSGVHLKDSIQSEEIDYSLILSQIIIRLKNLYMTSEIIDTFENTDITINLNPISISSNLNGNQLWNNFFDIIYQKRGDRWLNSIESIVNKVSSIYDLKMPHVYNSKLRELLEKQSQVVQENQALKDEITRLLSKVEESKEASKKCPITGLYNKEVFSSYLNDSYERIKDHSALIFIEIDQIEAINNKYSKKIGDDTIRMISYLLLNSKEENETLFRGYGSGFILIIENTNKENVRSRAIFLKNLIKDSSSFVQDITIGQGIVMFDEFINQEKEQAINNIVHQGQVRIEFARTLQSGSIISESKSNMDIFEDKVLLVDEDEINVNMLTKYFYDEEIELLHAKNPLEALEIINHHNIKFIISEINLSKLDGFALKQTLNKTENFAKIPFMFISHLKNNLSIERANKLSVDYFLKKPYYPNEVIGIVKRMMKR